MDKARINSIAFDLIDEYLENAWNCEESENTFKRFFCQIDAVADLRKALIKDIEGGIRNGQIRD